MDSSLSKVDKIVNPYHGRLGNSIVACTALLVLVVLILQNQELLGLSVWSFSFQTTFSVDSLDNSDASPEEEVDQFESSCVWSPSDKTSLCFAPLFQHMQASLKLSRKRFREETSGDQIEPRQRRYLNRRWLFLGDSTIFRLFVIDRVEKYLVEQAVGLYRRQQGPCYSNPSFLECTKVSCHRCDTMSQLGLTPASSWQKPNFVQGEGPMAYGFRTPYCSDCDGCNSNLLTCSLRNNATDICSNLETEEGGSSVYTGPAYGGYLSIEFAKDVELQTPEYKTTQENLLSSYIAQRWNAPMEMIEEFGRPICVVGAGHHDISVPNITKAIYLENVKWYLDIVSQQCDYVLWLTNNCPLTDDYAQTKEATFEWNMAVKEILLSSRVFRRKSFVLDVFNASIEHPHKDNLHMDHEWYVELASFLRELMDADMGWY